MFMVNSLIGFAAGGRDAPIVVSIGADEAAATSFSLDPSSLGAAIGDIMVVMAAWEASGDAISPPAGWTEHVDQTSAESAKRVSLHSIVFASVPGSISWTAGATANVAYSWCIVRGASSVESASYTDGSTAVSVGADTISTTMSGSRIAAVLGVACDGSTETNETATLSNVSSVANGGTGHTAGLYSIAGFTTASITSTYTTTQFQRATCGNFLTYLQ